MDDLDLDSIRKVGWHDQDGGGISTWHWGIVPTTDFRPDVGPPRVVVEWKNLLTP